MVAVVACACVPLRRGECILTENQNATRACSGGTPFTLKKRLEFVGKYKFVMITEFSIEDDWVSPEWSQAFMAGTVPVRPSLHMCCGRHRGLARRRERLCLCRVP